MPTDQKTIDSAGKQIESEFGKLDILVNNAGIISDGDRLPPSQVDIETLRHTYDTNVFGVFAVTKAVLPLLKKSTAGIKKLDESTFYLRSSRLSACPLFPTPHSPLPI